MPTYQYRCADCGAELEVVQKFTDHALTECPSCTGHLRKVYNAVGVHFKGSGFYATDSKSKNTASTPASGSSSSTDANSSGTSSTPSSASSSSASSSSASSSASSPSSSTSGSSTTKG